jgi:hypothetical protein
LTTKVAGERSLPISPLPTTSTSLKPYGWYKDFVLAGGGEHGLPPEYITECIRSVETIEDPDKTRDKKQRATLGSLGQVEPRSI